jgi:hypothetical protein
MIDALAAVVIVVALATAGWSLVAAVRDRPADRTHLVALGLLEAVLLVQAVVACIKLAAGEGAGDGVTFVGYVIGSLLIPPAGAGWGLLERSRFGPAVLVVAGLSVAVMTVRMQQIWSGTGG